MIRSDYVRGFAFALFSLAQETSKLENYKQEASDIIKSLKNNSAFLTLLNLKSISFLEKTKIVKTTFKSILNLNITNLIGLLIRKSQIKILERILTKLISLINKELKIKEGIIYSTVLLNSQEVKKIETFVSREVNLKVELQNFIDKSLISGFKINVGDKIIEDNVLSRISQIKQDLLERIK